MAKKVKKKADSGQSSNPNAEEMVALWSSDWGKFERPAKWAARLLERDPSVKLYDGQDKASAQNQSSSDGSDTNSNAAENKVEG